MNRICNQCQTEMIEDCSIRPEFKFDDIVISKKFKGIFNTKNAKLKAAVCPSCGNVVIYTEEYREFL